MAKYAHLSTNELFDLLQQQTDLPECVNDFLVRLTNVDFDCITEGSLRSDYGSNHMHETYEDEASQAMDLIDSLLLGACDSKDLSEEDQNLLTRRYGDRWNVFGD